MRRRLGSYRAKQSLESQVQQTNIVQLEHATEPLTPSSPRLKRNLSLAVALGLVLGLTVVFGLELLDRRVRSDEELRELTGVPLLGVLA